MFLLSKSLDHENLSSVFFMINAIFVWWSYEPFDGTYSFSRYDQISRYTSLFVQWTLFLISSELLFEVEKIPKIHRKFYQFMLDMKTMFNLENIISFILKYRLANDYFNKAFSYVIFLVYLHLEVSILHFMIIFHTFTSMYFKGFV